MLSFFSIFTIFSNDAHSNHENLSQPGQFCLRPHQRRKSRYVSHQMSTRNASSTMSATRLCMCGVGWMLSIVIVRALWLRRLDAHSRKASKRANTSTTSATRLVAAALCTSGAIKELNVPAPTSGPTHRVEPTMPSPIGGGVNATTKAAFDLANRRKSA